MNVYEIFIAAGVVVIAYAWVSNRLNAQMDAYREQLADTAAVLLESPQITDELHDRIEAMTENIFSMRLAWLYAVALPVALVIVGFQRFVLRMPTPPSSVPVALKEDFARFVKLSMLVITGNSVLTFVIGGIAFFMARITLIPFLAVAISVERWSNNLSRLDGSDHRFGH